MKSKYSDLVAASMNATLNNTEYQSLFKSYKIASDENDAKKSKKCAECGEDMKNDKCDCGYAKDKSWAKDKKKCPECGEHMKHDKCDCGYADDDMNMDDDSGQLPTEPTKPMPMVTAYDVAIDSLLTASAALDSVSLGHQSSMALKLASLVSEAKKLSKEERAENFKKMLAAKKEKEMKDKNKAKDKAMKEKMMLKDKAEKEKAKAKAEKEKAKAKK